MTTRTSGFESLKKHGTTLRQEVLERARTYDGIVLGTQSHADYPAPEKGGRNISAASASASISMPTCARRGRGRSCRPTCAAGRTMDLVIMREATEGFYADRNMTRGSGECMPSPDMALATRKITRHCSERIARASFELAMTRRRKVTAIHKANCFLMTDGLFLEAVRHVAKDFPEVASTNCWSMPRRRISCARPSVSTCSAGRISSATSCPISRANCRAAWASPARSTPATRTAARRPSTARPPTSPARTSPTRPR